MNGVFNFDIRAGICFFRIIFVSLRYDFSFSSKKRLKTRCFFQQTTGITNSNVFSRLVTTFEQLCCISSCRKSPIKELKDCSRQDSVANKGVKSISHRVCIRKLRLACCLKPSTPLVFRSCSFLPLE